MEVVDIRVPPEKHQDKEFLIHQVCKKARIKKQEIKDWQIIRRSIDARGKPKYQLRIRFSTECKLDSFIPLTNELNPVHNKPEIHIIGAGPTGYFAALELIVLGYKPIVFEQGRDVQARRRDLRAIQQFSKVSAVSNYCFGEGGAGTYSDGKLYTRSHKRGNIERVLNWLVAHGAHADILVDAHPHIGSNKLPGVIKNIRESIINNGGEVHFESKLTDFEVKNGQISKFIINHDTSYNTDNLLIATGHSARDIFQMVADKDLAFEFKPFALGVRVEHPQSLIDKIQYGNAERGPHLPAASYRLACEIDGDGVFSFCMCPGGLIVPAATAPGEIVVNGMSLSRRDSPFSNSGMVVAVNEEHLTDYQTEGNFKGLVFQKEIEKRVFDLGDGSQAAPAQRLIDFVEGKLSEQVNKSSYIPGVYSAPVHELLPERIYHHIKKGLKVFDRRMRGYLTNDAQVVATESRTSSPIRILRDEETLMHPQAKGLFPGGEGAGYAGGIVSAAMDGERIARAIAAYKAKTA